MRLIKTLTLAGYGLGLLGVAAAAAATGAVVTQGGKAFSEKSLSIAAGDSVTFRNDDGVKHNILVPDLDFNSGIQEPGQDVVVKFEDAGKYKVRCGIHPKMKMTVKVN